MIKLLFLDVDGTLTDGKIYMGNTGEMMKAFNVKDGYAIGRILPEHDIVPVIITGRKSRIAVKRCYELGIEQVYQNVKVKKEKMISVAKKYNIDMDEQGILLQTAYFGDDIPDLECMRIAQKKGCPADAVECIRSISDFISTKNGGDGAVREFIEWLCDDTGG